MITFHETIHRLAPGLPIKVRSTAVSTSNGVVVITPIEFSADQLSKIRSQGEVKAVVSPNANHTIDEEECRSWFPNAQFWSSDGTSSVEGSLEKYHSLALEPWPFSPELQLIPIQGHKKMNEFVFYHLESKSLISSDLVFNLKEFNGFLPRILLGAMGLKRKFSIPKAFWGKPDDLAAFKSSLLRVLNLDFDQLVVAHGEIVTVGAKSLFRNELVDKGLV
jgi:hypothetical protein